MRHDNTPCSPEVHMSVTGPPTCDGVFRGWVLDESCHLVIHEAVVAPDAGCGVAYIRPPHCPQVVRVVDLQDTQQQQVHE